MKRILTFIAIAATLAVASSCSKSRAEQMAMADNVTATCSPEVLEIVSGKIPATVTITYPDGYFNTHALMVVTPVLVYEGGSQMGQPTIYQGEDVKDNNKVVPTTGATVSQKCEFAYVEGMERSTLELQCVAFCGEKRIEIPSIKVAEGCIATYKLVDLNGAYIYKEDNYQEVLKKTTEGQIRYDVNSDKVKDSEMRSQSIRELKAAIGEIADDSHYTVTGTRIVAYASPEGGKDLNAKLSDKRASSAKKAWDSISEGLEADELQVLSMGQDWDGFKDAVEHSNIEDKELILRVLSMYSDPAVRESEIRNLSQVYTEISDKVFPVLRRARFITEYEYKNLTDSQLQELADKYVGMLDEEGLLRVASNSTNVDRKRQLYKIAVQKFGSQRAQYNLAAMSLDADEPAVAENYLRAIENLDADAVNVKGVIALRRMQYDDAADLFKSSGSAEAKANLGAIEILNGDYTSAAAHLKGSLTDNEALLDILTGDLGAASKCLKDSGSQTAVSDYLRAIVAARKGESSVAKSHLDNAIAKDPSLKERAANDIEFR